MKAHARLIRIALLFLAGLLTIALMIVGDGLTDELGKADAALVLGNTVDPQGNPSPPSRPASTAPRSCIGTAGSHS